MADNINNELYNRLNPPMEAAIDPSNDGTPTDKTNIYVEQGISGLTRFGGFIYEEWLKELQGKKGALTYREMRDNDAVIGSFLYAIEMLVRQVKWIVKPSGDKPVDKEAAEFLESCLNDMETSWNDTVSEILTFLPYGWCWMEMCYKIRKGQDSTDPIYKSKYNDGRIAWRKWGVRAQETLWRWDFEPDGRVKGMEQIAPPDYKTRYIPMDKSLLFRTKSNKDNPEGRSILRNAYRSWYFKKNIEEIEAIGIERDLEGFPIMWIPPEIFEKKTPEATSAYNMYKKIVTNIKRDEQEGLMLPLIYDDKGNKAYDLTLLASGSTRKQFDTNQIIQRYEQRIAMTVMADFLLIGHEKAGSFALSKNKTSLFQTALGTILQNICDVINTQAVPSLFKLNSFNGLVEYPKITHDELEKVNLDELGNFIQKVVGAGAITVKGDTDLENYLRQAAQFPKRPDGLKDVEDVEDVEDTDDDDDNNVDNEKIEKSADDREIFIQAVKELRDSLRKGDDNNGN